MIARNREEGSKSAYIGAACYPTLAMFNHSCDPSIIRFYIEDYVCVQTIKNIKKGEEICENYGPIFFHSAKEDRVVSKYSFYSSFHEFCNYYFFLTKMNVVV